MPAEKFHENKSRLVPEKIASARTQMLFAFKEINRSLLKVDKNQKIGNRTFGNCYIALYRNECRVVAKEMKIIEPPKKTREEEWREASAVTRIGDHWGIPLLFGVCTDRAPF